jgi:hypothetical protein
MAAEKAKELEVQAARFGHASAGAKTTAIVGRRVISNKRFSSPAINQQQTLNAQSKTLVAVVQNPLVSGLATSVEEKVDASITHDAWSDTSGDEPDIEGDE